MGIFLQKMDASCPSIVLFYIVSFHQHRKSGKIVTHISRLIYSIFPLLVVKKKSAFFWYLYNTLWPYLLKFCVSFMLLFLQGCETKLRWTTPANKCKNNILSNKRGFTILHYTFAREKDEMGPPSPPTQNPFSVVAY